MNDTGDTKWYKLLGRGVIQGHVGIGIGLCAVYIMHIHMLLFTIEACHCSGRLYDDPMIRIYGSVAIGSCSTRPTFA